MLLLLFRLTRSISSHSGVLAVAVHNRSNNLGLQQIVLPCSEPSSASALTGNKVQSSAGTSYLLDQDHSLAKRTDFGETIPEEYLAKPRPERPEGVDLRYLLMKKFKGSPNISKGTPMGYEVAISRKLSKSGEKISKYFSAREIGWVECAELARRYRDEQLKQPLPAL